MAAIQITESVKSIEKKINNAIANHFNRAVPRALQPIDDAIVALTLDVYRDSATYHSLINGLLKYNFGLPSDAKARVENILQTIVENLETSFYPFKVVGNEIRGKIRIQVLRTNFNDVLGLSTSTLNIESTHTTGDVLNIGESLELPWLQWLLIEGDTIIINDYDILYKPGAGRSGGAIMVPRDSRSWRVPPQFSGTIDNNWLTRTLVDGRRYLSGIAKIIEREINKVI
jgi:hypothetical protein